MLIVMEMGATESQIQEVIDRLVDLEFTVHRSTGMVHTVLGCVGPAERVDPAWFSGMPGVKECRRITSPYKIAGRQFRPEGTVVQVAGLAVGGERIAVMAGPHAVESRDQIFLSAQTVAACGVSVLRAGVFLARTSPYYGYRELGEQGLRLLREAADAHALLAASEALDPVQLPVVASYVDIVQVSARNMQNIQIVRELTQLGKPVLISRGPSDSLDELLLAAESVLAGSHFDVILAEPDIANLPMLKKLSHLPVVAGPDSAPMARAAVAAGCDGLLLGEAQLAGLMDPLAKIALAVGRSL